MNTQCSICQRSIEQCRCVLTSWDKLSESGRILRLGVIAHQLDERDDLARDVQSQRAKIEELYRDLEAEQQSGKGFADELQGLYASIWSFVERFAPEYEHVTEPLRDARDLEKLVRVMKARGDRFEREAEQAREQLGINQADQRRMAEQIHRMLDPWVNRPEGDWVVGHVQRVVELLEAHKRAEQKLEAMLENKVSTTVRGDLYAKLEWIIGKAVDRLHTRDEYHIALQKIGTALGTGGLPADLWDYERHDGSDAIVYAADMLVRHYVALGQQVDECHGALEDAGIERHELGSEGAERTLKDRIEEVIGQRDDYAARAETAEDRVQELIKGADESAQMLLEIEAALEKAEIPLVEQPLGINYTPAQRIAMLMRERDAQASETENINDTWLKEHTVAEERGGEIAGAHSALDDLKVANQHFGGRPMTVRERIVELAAQLPDPPRYLERELHRMCDADLTRLGEEGKAKDERIQRLELVVERMTYALREIKKYASGWE